MSRRVLAIIISASVIVVLIAAYFVVRNIVNTTAYTDVDQTKYYIKKKGGTYSMYDGDGFKLSVDEQYGYYITDAGTLIDLDGETGEYETVAVVDTEGNEVVGFNSRILMFPHIEKSNLRSLEVHNSSGTFTFYRYNINTGLVDDTCDFVIKGSILTSYNQELFASLYVSAGYTITTRKIIDPIKDGNGEFSEYGLVSETRTDEEGNEYTYTPAYYILTDKSGNKYKVIIGDKLITGGGYYVQYVSMENGAETKRDAVYVLGSDIEESLLQPIESFVTPTMVYPMSMNNYFDVDEFTIYRRNGEDFKKVVAFSYIDLSLRENTIEASRPYQFNSENLDGYTPSSDNIDACLQYMYTTSFVGVKKLSPTDSDLVKYGLAVDSVDDEGKPTIDFNPAYMLSFYFDTTDSDGKFLSTIYQVVMISEKNEDGNYYVYTAVYDGSTKSSDKELLYTYDMIAEVEGYCLDFLTWEPYAWISSSYISLNIAYCDEITLSSPGYSATFKLDNSKSDQTNGTSSSNLSVHGTDSNGNDVYTFSTLTVTDTNGNQWTITPSEITATSPTGTSLTIETAYYAYNAMGSQVRVVSGYIACADGSRVQVTADNVIVTSPSGEVTTYLRYATNLFRRFYQTLLYASIEDSYPMTEEEENALISDESKWLLTITVKNSEGVTNTYSFYSLTSRKAYITINGNGGFYVLPNRVAKFISDSQKFFANEIIDATAKN